MNHHMETTYCIVKKHITTLNFELPRVVANHVYQIYKHGRMQISRFYVLRNFKRTRIPKNFTSFNSSKFSQKFFKFRNFLSMNQ